MVVDLPLPHDTVAIVAGEAVTKHAVKTVDALTMEEGRSARSGIHDHTATRCVYQFEPSRRTCLICGASATVVAQPMFLSRSLLSSYCTECAKTNPRT